MSTRHIRIGAVAQRTGLSLATIRFYAATGLIADCSEENDTTTGYSEADVARLSLLKDVGPLGFSLAELGNMLAILDILRSERILPAYRLALLQRLDMYRHIVILRRGQLLDELAALERVRSRLEDQLAR